MEEISQKWKAKSVQELSMRASAFPSCVYDDLKDLSQKLVLKAYYEGELSSSHPHVEVNVCNESMTIPYRVYYKEILETQWDALTDKQKVIFSCLNTRNSNGYVREKYLRFLLQSEEVWCIPYILLLLGEYVSHISAVVMGQVELLDKTDYQKFASDNPILMDNLIYRTVSYWDCYYRHRPKGINDYRDLSSYPSVAVLKHLGLWNDGYVSRMVRRARRKCL